MNVYDFDKTIYDGDSTADFYFFCLKRHKKMLLFVPSLCCAYVNYYVFGRGTKTQFKEKMYRFLSVCNTKRDVTDFWNKNLCKIKALYYDRHKDDDVIISASPQFLLKPLEKKLHFTVIASDVSPDNGKYNGINCYHEEKVRRFRMVYQDGVIDEFYSDSYSDEPLARIAKKAFTIDGNKILNWNYDIHRRVK